MTMHITPSRPSMAGMNETTAIRDWQARRYGQTSIPASSTVRLGNAPEKWNISRFGETGVTNWDIPANSGGMGSRRTWKRKLPESSLMGLGSLGRHTGTPAQRQWGINPLSETTYVENTASRRPGMQRYMSDGAWAEQASLSGFGAFGADLDSEASVRDVQDALRKLGRCRPAGSLLVADGVFGPITNAGLTDALRAFNSTVPGASALPAARAFQASSGANKVRMSSLFWTWMQAQAAGQLDQCSAAGGGGGGGSPSPDPADNEADLLIEESVEPAWYAKPTNWLIAALVAGGAYAAYSYANKNDDDMFMSSGY